MAKAVSILNCSLALLLINLCECQPNCGNFTPSSLLDRDAIPIVFVDCVVREKWPHDRSTMIHVARIARLFNPSEPIYLITENRTSAEVGILLALRIIVRNCSCYFDSSNEVEFTRNYIHSSVNIFEKEKFCFTRFMMLQEFIRREQLSHVLFVDADILLMPNATIQLRPTNSTIKVRSLFAGGTYFSFWTEKGVSLFVDFMIGFYKRPREAIAGDLMKFGSNKFKSTDANFVAQFTDMHMFRAFEYNNSDIVQVDFPRIEPLIRADAVRFTTTIALRIGFRNQSTCKEDFSTFTARFLWENAEIGGVAVELPIPKPTASSVYSGASNSFIALHFQGVFCKRLVTKFTARICPIAKQLHAMRAPPYS